MSLAAQCMPCPSCPTIEGPPSASELRSCIQVQPRPLPLRVVLVFDGSMLYVRPSSLTQLSDILSLLRPSHRDRAQVRVHALRCCLAHCSPIASVATHVACTRLSCALLATHLANSYLSSAGASGMTLSWVDRRTHCRPKPDFV